MHFLAANSYLQINTGKLSHRRFWCQREIQQWIFHFLSSCVQILISNSITYPFSRWVFRQASFCSLTSSVCSPSFTSVGHVFSKVDKFTQGHVLALAILWVFLRNRSPAFLCRDDYDWLSRGSLVHGCLIPQNILLYIACREQTLSRDWGWGLSHGRERACSLASFTKKLSLCLSSLLTDSRVRIKYS